jgi:hypothetical protein
MEPFESAVRADFRHSKSGLFRLIFTTSGLAISDLGHVGQR